MFGIDGAVIQAAAEAIERPEQFGEEPVGGSLRHFRLALLLDACGLRQQCFEPAGSFRLSSQDSRIVGRQAKPTLITAALCVRQFGKRPDRKSGVSGKSVSVRVELGGVR